MAVFYNRIERGNPANPKAPKKWYVALKSLGLVRERAVAKQIAAGTTLSAKDAELALGQLNKVVANNLLSGHTVQLGDIGSLYLVVTSLGSENKEEVSAVNNVTRISIRFKPSRVLQDAVDNAQFKALDDY
ncbi:MAG: HU family DNA-binding protein [Prevotellaceae bacterium]|jgi:predicted histone-like DNA-binding protein|nr:HU family DNA-binding protein [Prevotellaceae bacterium]